MSKEIFGISTSIRRSGIGSSSSSSSSGFSFSSYKKLRKKTPQFSPISLTRINFHLQNDFQLKSDPQPKFKLW